ncbi:hypothetical protein [uncultured Draconibacterium sp.]|uniref:hypothetical protein n=1 Tax=uncultured Draconibacterium sp. TaxID=1573823 RepID=UPI0029C6D72A|nr:hypothetical protein [uncultured Draconibacterium sp.]
MHVQGSQETFPFFLDTGASNIIFSSHKNQFKLKRNGFGIGKGASLNFFTTKINQCSLVQIGAFMFKEVSFEEVNINSDCVDEICGIIGTGIMHNLEWQIDFNNMEIIIADSLKHLQIPADAISLPLEQNPFTSHLHTKIKFRKNKRQHSVLIDVGNSGTLNLKQSTILKDSISFETKKVLGIDSNSLGKEKVSESEDSYFLADSIYFRNLGVHQVPVTVAPKCLDLLGLGFFEHYKTTISYKTSQLFLEPYQSNPRFIWNTYGFFTDYDEVAKKTIISNIVENSPAANKNVPLYAEVLSINDFKFSDKESYCQYKNNKSFGGSVELTLNNNGNIKKYYLESAPIFE